MHHHHLASPILWLIQEERENPSWRCSAWYARSGRHRDGRTEHYAALFISKGLGRHIFTALLRPLQASTLAGTAHWASRCRFLIWPWCALWWRTTITEQKTTLWASSLCLSQACEQVLVHAHTKAHIHLLGCYYPSCVLLHSVNYNLSFQVIDMFTYWRQMAPVCPPQRFSSMSKWPAKASPSRACQSALPWPKARRLDGAHQKIAAFSDGKKRGVIEKEPAAASCSPGPELKWSNFTLRSTSRCGGGVGGNMPFTQYEAACWLLANDCGRIMNGDHWGSVWLSQRFGNMTENCGFLRNRRRICPKINFIVNSHIWRSHHFSQVGSCQLFILETSFLITFLHLL